MMSLRFHGLMRHCSWPSDTIWPAIVHMIPALVAEKSKARAKIVPAAGARVEERRSWIAKISAFEISSSGRLHILAQACSSVKKVGVREVQGAETGGGRFVVIRNNLVTSIIAVVVWLFLVIMNGSLVVLAIMSKVSRTGR